MGEDLNKQIETAIDDGDLVGLQKLVTDADTANTALEHGETVLMHAVSAGQVEIVKFLIYKGANVNAKDKFGYTPLMYVVNGGISKINSALPIAQLLVENKADVNAVDTSLGDTVLMHVAIAGYTEVAAFLIEKGAEIHKKNNSGVTALYEAAVKKNNEVCEVIVDAKQFDYTKEEINKIKRKNGDVYNYIKSKMEERGTPLPEPVKKWKIALSAALIVATAIVGSIFLSPITGPFGAFIANCIAISIGAGIYTTIFAPKPSDRGNYITPNVDVDKEVRNKQSSQLFTDRSEQLANNNQRGK